MDNPAPVPSAAPDTAGSGLLHLVRVLRSDFTRIGATPGERRLLAVGAAGVDSPAAQDYLAWRLSMAWVGLLAALVSTGLTLIDWIDDLDASLPGGIEFVGFLNVAVRGGLALGLLVAIRRWTDPRASRGAFRFAYASGFFGPLAIGLIPLIAFFPEPSADGGAALELLEREVFKVLIGLLYLGTLAPSFLSIFPGLVRAGLTVKTLLPATGVGAALAGLFAPVYSLALFVGLIVLQQIGGSLPLVAGTVLVGLAPLVVARRTFALAAPATAEAAGAAVRRVRTQARLLLLAGGALLVVASLEMRVLGYRFVGAGEGVLFGPLNLVEMVIWFVATMTTFTAVATDGILHGMAAVHSRRAEWLARPEAAEAERQTAALAVAFLPPERPPPS